MPRYHTLGQIPNKRHITFENPAGGLYQEELFGTAGFAGMSSLIYHLYPPTVVSEIKRLEDVTPKVAIEKNMQALSFQGFSLKPENDYIKSRKTLFVNGDMHIGLAAPKSFSSDYFYRNSDADEMLFIHVGTGTLRTMYGNLEFGCGDYIIIPRGTTYQIDFKTQENKILYIESFGEITTPRRYRNDYGQFLEHSPFCERDFRLPQNLKTHDEKGSFRVI
ncbi:MAG: homogentisate 1,2-dioxygenase, partial [bacterium]